MAIPPCTAQQSRQTPLALCRRSFAEAMVLIRTTTEELPNIFYPLFEIHPYEAHMRRSKASLKDTEVEDWLPNMLVACINIKHFLSFVL
jgi:hypothetical protein